MKHLKKIWVRAVLSIFLSAGVSEIIQISTGKDLQGLGMMLILFFFAILSLIAWLWSWRFFNKSKRSSIDESTLDEDLME